MTKKIQKKIKERIFVGLSGGVDSSVAALRLTKAGYDVVGVFIRVWHPDFIECNEEAERLDAMRVAAHLGIPYLELDARDEYKKEVADYMIREYESGRTPNPDVLCNRIVKFDAFWRFAKSYGADAIATGHYARIEKLNDGYILKEAVDAEKDQTYFLWMLTEDDLSHVLFPIGDTRKEDVRKEARAAGLPTFEKKDSQGVCFLGAIDMKEFLSHYIDAKPGVVRDMGGKIIGTHDGAFFYTIGERHGFTIRGKDAVKPHYVIEKSLESNTLTVGTESPAVSDRSLALKEVNWIGDAETASLSSIDVRTRYREALVKGGLERSGERYILELDETADLPALGQSAVFYLQNRCIGGGIIEAYADHGTEA